jgi:hypothetical protein
MLRIPSARHAPGQAGAAGGERDPVGDDEAGIEADAELADELGILLLVAGELAEELLGAGLGDGADVLDHLLAAHADAVVADGDGLGILVHADLDLQFGILLEQGRVGQGLEAQLVGGIAGVGNQFPEEDFLVAVEGMDHQVKQLLHLGLEAQGFLGGGFGHGGELPCE